MAKKPTESTALVKEEPKALQSFDYSEYGGGDAGYENQGAEDQSIPFINLLQPGSPVVTQQTVDGAVAGMWWNNVTNQLWDSKKNNLIVIPVFTKHEYIQWKPRKAGGGFVNRYDIDDPIVAQSKQNSTKFGRYFIEVEEKNRCEDDFGDELQETFTVFALQCDEDPEGPMGMAIMPFKSSMIKTYKNWMSSVRAHQTIVNGKRTNTPLFSHLSRLTSKFESKNGNTWFIPQYAGAVDGKVADSCLPPEDPRFLAAFQMYQFVKGGTVKANYAKQTNDEGTGGEVGADGLPLGPDGKPLF